MTRTRLGPASATKRLRKVYATHDEKLNCDDKLRDRRYALSAVHVGSVKAPFHFIRTMVSELAFQAVSIMLNVVAFGRGPTHAVYL